MKHPSFTAFLRQVKIEHRTSPEARSRPLPGFLLDSKLAAYQFAADLGVQVPKTLSFDRRLRAVTIVPPCVVKPVAEDSARGVYIVRGEDDIFEVGTGTVLSNLQELRNSAFSLLRTGQVAKNRWMSEELILDAGGAMAKDMKFYCFYGRAPLALETRREPAIARCWYNRDGAVIDTGKYSDSLFGGTGYEDDARILAEKVSMAIPSPFIRIDLLLGKNGVFLGEITPVPANFQGFSTKIDRWLGREMMQASIRICRDVAYGKQFQVRPI